MFYAVFGSGEIRKAKTEKALFDELDVELDFTFFEPEENLDEIKGDSNSFVVISGEIVAIEKVWRKTKETV